MLAPRSNIPSQRPGVGMATISGRQADRKMTIEDRRLPRPISRTREAGTYQRARHQHSRARPQRLPTGSPVAPWWPRHPAKPRAARHPGIYSRLESARPGLLLEVLARPLHFRPRDRRSGGDGRVPARGREAHRFASRPRPDLGCYGSPRLRLLRGAERAVCLPATARWPRAVLGEQEGHGPSSQ